MDPEVISAVASLYFDRDDAKVTKGINLQVFFENLQKRDPFLGAFVRSFVGRIVVLCNQRKRRCVELVHAGLISPLPPGPHNTISFTYKTNDWAAAMPEQMVMVARVAVFMRGLGTFMNHPISIARAWRPLAVEVLKEKVPQGEEEDA